MKSDVRLREAFMAHWARILADPKVTARTILCEGQVAGNIVSYERSDRTLVGYWLGQEHWGKGVASRAGKLEWFPLGPGQVYVPPLSGEPSLYPEGEPPARAASRWIRC